LYQLRSDIVHGKIGLSILPEDILTLYEIVRQLYLKYVSLYSQGYRNISKKLDDSLHDPKIHSKLLADSNFYFGKHSQYKELRDWEKKVLKIK
jgi:hypothetical protein